MLLQIPNINLVKIFTKFKDNDLLFEEEKTYSDENLIFIKAQRIKKMTII